MPDSIPQVNPDFSKRYWLFLWHNYEPRGGLNDFQDSFEWLETAESYADVVRGFDGYDEGEIFDSETRKVVSRFDTNSKWKHYA
jgi:hypothetical protein